MFCIAMAMLGLVFFLREMEVDNAGPISAYLESRLLRTHEALVVAAVISFYLVFRWSLIGGVWFCIQQIGMAILCGSHSAFGWRNIRHISRIGPKSDKGRDLRMQQLPDTPAHRGSYLLSATRRQIRSTSADFLMVVVTVSLFAGACWLTRSKFHDYHGSGHQAEIPTRFYLVTSMR